MYKMNSRIRYSEIDFRGTLSMTGLVNYLQDCNTFQAEECGYTIENCAAMNRVWVLSAWQIVIYRMPVLGEVVEVCTWPYSFKGFTGLRNYTMKSADGELLVEANGIWTLLDLEKRIPVRITDWESSGYVIGEKLDMDYAPRRIKVEGHGEEKSPIRIGRERLDTNGHMNNAQYVALAEEYVPDGMTTGQIRVEYKKEVKYGMDLIPVVYTEDDKVTVVFRDDDSTIAVVEFLKRKEQI